MYTMKHGDSSFKLYFFNSETQYYSLEKELGMRKPRELSQWLHLSSYVSWCQDDFVIKCLWGCR